MRGSSAPALGAVHRRPGLQSLKEAIGDLHRRGVRVIISGANERVRDKLAIAGILERVGAGNCFADFEQALAAAK